MISAATALTVYLVITNPTLIYLTYKVTKWTTTTMYKKIKS